MLEIPRSEPIDPILAYRGVCLIAVSIEPSSVLRPLITLTFLTIASQSSDSFSIGPNLEDHTCGVLHAKPVQSKKL